MKIRFRELEIRLRVHRQRGTDVEEDSFLRSRRVVHAELMRDARPAVVGADVETVVS